MHVNYIAHSGIELFVTPCHPWCVCCMHGEKDRVPCSNYQFVLDPVPIHCNLASSVAIWGLYLRVMGRHGMTTKRFIPCVSIIELGKRELWSPSKVISYYLKYIYIYIYILLNISNEYVYATGNVHVIPRYYMEYMKLKVEHVSYLPFLDDI